MFSVIIPLYNKEKSIKNTIDSVLNQTFADFEIVVVNDGSTDNSLAVVSEVQDDRIRIITQENQGVSSARNRGIKESKNHWIAFLDGDDVWKPNHLEEMKRLIEKHAHFQFFATSFTRTDGKEISMWKPEEQDYVITDYFEGMLHQHMVWTGVVVLHRSIFDMIDGFNPNLTIGEDLDLWARIGKLLPLVKSNLVTAEYRLEAENRSKKVPDEFDKSIFSVLYFNEEMPLTERRYYRKILLTMVKSSIKAKNWKMVRKILSKYNTNLI